MKVKQAQQVRSNPSLNPSNAEERTARESAHRQPGHWKAVDASQVALPTGVGNGEF